MKKILLISIALIVSTGLFAQITCNEKSLSGATPEIKAALDKNKNAFDAEAQKVAFEMTYNAVIKVLSAEATEYLTSIYGDLSVYITNMIEAEVNRNKVKLAE